MSTTVYKIVWADDEVDALKDIFEKRFNDSGIQIIGKAHDGEELEKVLSEIGNRIDAVIVDANFNESEIVIEEERDTSGLTFARHLSKSYPLIPFFLFTQRSDEMLKEIYRSVPKFFEEFPRHKRWFKKTAEGEFDEMINAIKTEVIERKSPNFVISNRYQYELNAATILDGTEDFIREFLIRDYENTLEEMIEPFIRVRRGLEKMFGKCEKTNLIPPISDDFNGTADYFLYQKYSPKDKDGNRVLKYEMIEKKLMPMPIARALSYVVNIVQDSAHSKDKLKLKVDEYFANTKDTLLLKSVVFTFMDCVKWFVITVCKNNDYEHNAIALWKEA